MITTDLNRAEFDGDGSETVFIFRVLGTDIPIRDQSHIKVYLGTVLQTITTHYTVAFTGTTATVTFGTAPVSGTKNILFIREVPFKQETDLVNNSQLEAESLETQLDLIVNQTQQLNDRIDRNFRLSDTLTAANATSTHTTLNVTSALRANKSLKFDASGNLATSTLDADELVTLATAQVTLAIAQVALANTQRGLAEAASTTAVTAKEAAEELYDNFDDRYLGVKSSDPTVDNDTNALVDGAIYYDSTNDYIKVYDSSLTPKWRQITTTVANQTNIDVLTTKYDGSTSAGSGTNLNIAQVNTAALSIANVNNFADLYQIDDFDPVPTKDGGGVDALAKGDLAFDTTLNALRVYNGTAWSTGVNTTEGVVVTQEYTANGSLQHFALAHDQGMEIVYLNGVKLLAGNGSSNNDFFSVSGGSSTTYVGDGNAATHIYFHSAPANTHLISFVAWGASANTLAVSKSGGTFTGAVTFSVAPIFSAVPTFSAGLGAVTASTVNSVILFTTGTANCVIGPSAGGGPGGGNAYTNASYNTGFGTHSQWSMNTGDNNCTFGAYALDSAISGNYNCAFGTYTLSANYGGGYNSIFGGDGLKLGQNADNNSGLGYYTLYNTTGNNNTAVGYKSGDNITSGGSNICIGANTDALSATGSNHLNIGDTIYGTLGSGISIGVTSPNANAILDLTSTTKAFMLPRMTTTQMNAISSPTAGMMIYNTTTAGIHWYNTSWSELAET